MPSLSCLAMPSGLLGMAGFTLLGAGMGNILCRGGEGGRSGGRSGYRLGVERGAVEVGGEGGG